MTRDELITYQQLLVALDDDIVTLTDPIKKRLELQATASPECHTGQVGGQVTEQVENWVLEIPSACLEPKKSAEIQGIMGIKNRDAFQRNYLDRLLNDELLVRTIPDKPRSRLQAYRTKVKGRALLEQNRK